MGSLHRQNLADWFKQPVFSHGLSIEPSRRPSLRDFAVFSSENSGARIELEKNGTILIMPPVDYHSGVAEDYVHGHLYAWRLQTGLGQSFSPSTGFLLPDGSVRSADAAWAGGEKIQALSAKEKAQFPPLVPDFVIEVRSISDRISQLKRKMTDTWMANGVRLTWLIDPSLNARLSTAKARQLKKSKVSTKFCQAKTCAKASSYRYQGYGGDVIL